MRKLMALLMAVLCMFAFTACGSNGTSPQNGESDTITITFTHAVTENTSQHAGALAFKDYIESNSNGRMKVDIYPNAQMGGDREQIEGVQEGSITAMTSGSAPQVNFVNSAVIFDLPFAFATNDEATRTFTDEAFLAALSEEYAKSGFKLMGASNLDFRATTTNVPIHTPDDLKGLTIRTMENKYHIAMWKSMGANPTPLAFNELYTALQQNTVDGQENPIELIYAQKFYEQQKYVIKTRHLPQNLIWIMNKTFYDGLPADLQEVVEGAAQAAMKAAADYTGSNAERIEKELKDFEVEIIDFTPEELEPFAEKTKGVWDMIKADCEPEVYDTYTSTMQK